MSNSTIENWVYKKQNQRARLTANKVQRGGRNKR